MKKLVEEILKRRGRAPVSLRQNEALLRAAVKRKSKLERELGLLECEIFDRQVADLCFKHVHQIETGEDLF